MSLLKQKDALALLEDAQVSASTVRSCKSRLKAFLARYLPCFFREEQRGLAQVVLQGRLSHLDRKTCEPIARQAGRKRRPLQHFVGAGAWDDEAVMRELRGHVAEEFAGRGGTLVADGSAFPKKGRDSCGVQRQWCGRLGKIENCQVGTFLALVAGGRAAPLDRRLYLPREWAQDTDRRRQCHVPSTVRFAEKWQLSLKQIQAARDVPHEWIVADDEFGRVAEYRARLRKWKERYLLDVPCNTLVRVLKTPLAAGSYQTASQSSQTPGGQRRSKKRGRPRLPPWERADEWAARQPAACWQRIEVRAGEKSKLEVEVLHAPVQTTGGVREQLVVIRTLEATPQTHYCLSNADDDVTAEEYAWAHDDRHRIEELFQLGNGEVGLDHYEVRSWVGWHHHMTLSLLGLWFLTLEQSRVGEKNPGDHGAAGA